MALGSGETRRLEGVEINAHPCSTTFRVPNVGGDPALVTHGEIKCHQLQGRDDDSLVSRRGILLRDVQDWVFILDVECVQVTKASLE